MSCCRMGRDITEPDVRVGRGLLPVVVHDVCLVHHVVPVKVSANQSEIALTLRQSHHFPTSIR